MQVVYAAAMWYTYSVRKREKQERETRERSDKEESADGEETQAYLIR